MQDQKNEALAKIMLTKSASRTDKALALFVLSGDSRSKDICNALASDLQGKNWSWMRQYGLFEIALTAAALYKYSPSLFDGAGMAQLAKKMMANEVEIGGPYYNEARRVDIATNAAIALLFSTLKSPLPNVLSFLASHVNVHDERAYLSLILKTSFVDQYLAELIHSQNTSATIDQKIALRQPNAVETQVKLIIDQFDPALSATASLLWQSFIDADARQEITLLPRMFAESLVNRPDVITEDICHRFGQANFFTWMAYTVYDDFIDNEGTAAYLPVANVMMRRSIDTYKDITSYYPGIHSLIEKYFGNMDTANAWELENCRFSVTDEHIVIKNLPRYGNRMILAERAGCHVLGPIIMTFMHPEMTQRQRMYIQKGLFHFLIARQLNDDLHDWKTDFERGHISYVVGFLLRHINVPVGQHNVSALTDRMQNYFWKTGISEISGLVRKHINLARNYFARSGCVASSSPLFNELLKYVDDVARASIENHMNQKKFYLEYAEDKKNSEAKI